MVILYNNEKANDLFAKEHVQGQGSLGGFAFSVDGTRSYIATAIHAGGNVRDDLLDLMNIGEAERYFEEDPETDTMIQEAASQVWGLDSRCEYDLNRPPENAVPLTPQQFWGKKVYQTQPDPSLIGKSMAKYDQFYSFMSGWAEAMLVRFGICLVYDIHAYNISRQLQKGVSSPPVFNLGTGLVDRQRWAVAIEDWLDRLKAITIPGVMTTAAENRVFQGKGYLNRFLTNLDPRILVLSTEVAKVYMDEENGRVNQPTLAALRRGLGQAIRQHSHFFFERNNELI